MDKLELKIIEGNFGNEVRILINDKDIINTLKEYELPFALQEGSPGMAGGYSGLGKYELHFHLTRPENVNDIPILTCSGCGEWGCWPMMISLEETADCVTWKNFRQPHRGPNSKASYWDFSKFPKFTFAKEEYVKALESIKVIGKMEVQR